MEKKIIYSIVAIVIIVVASFAGWWIYNASVQQGPQVIRVAAIYEGSKEEPYSLLMHNALVRTAGEYGFIYSYSEIDPVDADRVLRDYAEKGYAIIFAHGYGFADAVKTVAADYPNVVFMHGDGLYEPIKPNVGLYTPLLYESAYVAGVLSGLLTETGVVGIVASFPIPVINAEMNGYIAGVKSVNESIKVKIIWLQSWFDPAGAKEAAITLIDDFDADIILAERFGAEQGAVSRGKYSIGFMMDTYESAPSSVITSVLWNLYPLVRDTYLNYTNNVWQPLDLRYGMFKNNYTSLASYRQFRDIIPMDIQNEVETIKEKIINGQIVVPLNWEQPAGD